ncbi:hypothetical protein XU18_2047 [Perkinsela sp. CCAP 1560/4]|nr:hypothetical protein XU18_2047 [Perkinsela sp. CCAP 1560/4]|eukprot:KNH07515.1 hypothetical protein XU18_2047 [Perkinsela sp. CCAP 1560/4]
MSDDSCPCRGFLINVENVSLRLKRYLILDKEIAGCSWGVVVFYYRGKILQSMGTKCQLNELHEEINGALSSSGGKCDLLILNAIEATYLYRRSMILLYRAWDECSEIVSLPSYECGNQILNNLYERTVFNQRMVAFLSVYEYFRKAGWLVENIQSEKKSIGFCEIRRSKQDARNVCMLRWSQEKITEMKHTFNDNVTYIGIVSYSSPNSEPVIFCCAKNVECSH